jgi:ferrochelatase/protoporphyrinogen oxidase
VTTTSAATAPAGTIGVVAMAYGTPRTPDEILPYYTDIRRGRPPTDEALADLTARYEAIGGVSPLARLTEAQQAALQEALDRLAPGTYQVVLGLKHADPKVEAAVDELATRGIERAVGVVFAPHYSAYSIGQYLGRMASAAEPHGIATTGVESWAVEPAFVDFLADDLARRLAAMPANTRVVFTAHSLPTRITESGDPYPDELRSTAEAVASRVGLAEGAGWQLGWQSAGRTPEPWLGPDILEVIDELAGTVDGVIVSAVGFVADHLEVLYDLDIEARARGRRARARVRSHRVRQRPPRRHRSARAARPRRRRTSGLDRGVTERVLVVGGGIAGLAAAVALVEHGGVDVELREATDRLGGKITTSPFAGVDAVDEGGDAFLVRQPHAIDLAHRVGLGADEITSPSPASATVWHDGLHRLPAGIVLGVPTDVAAFAKSGLLSWRGKLRAGLEPFLPRTDADDSIGRLVRGRFGSEVHERLVDALVGSIYAADTDRFSLAAVPQLADLARRNRSLLIGARAAKRQMPPPPPPGSPPAPIFGAPVRGIGALVDAAARFVTEHGGTVRTEAAVHDLAPDGRAWTVDGDRFDAVVLASPARATAPLLASIAPDAAAAMATVEHADVIMVRLAVPADQWPDRLAGLSGYLVPKSEQRTVTAASFGSQKWAHWRPADGTQIVRISLGRDGLPVEHLDDDEALRRAIDEFGRHVGADVAPVATSVTRWPGAFPQYRPHHADKVAAIEAALPDGIAVAGASYRGIGIPACVADGQRAASAVVARLERTR